MTKFPKDAMGEQDDKNGKKNIIRENTRNKITIFFEILLIFAILILLVMFYLICRYNLYELNSTYLNIKLNIFLYSSWISYREAVYLAYKE